MLNVKRKKRLSLGVCLIILGVGELIHNRLSGNRVVIKNYGISFGINGLIFILLSIIFILFLTVIFFKKKSFGLGLMVVGGWINLIDRLVWGYVRDYWRLMTVYNNLADWLIGVGVVLFLGEILCKKR